MPESIAKAAKRSGAGEIGGPIAGIREKRLGDGGEENERNKVRRVEGESRGDLVSEMPIDELEEDEWEQKRETIREEKVPFLVIKGHNAGRVI